MSLLRSLNFEDVSFFFNQFKMALWDARVNRSLDWRSNFLQGEQVNKSVKVQWIWMLLRIWWTRAA